MTILISLAGDMNIKRKERRKIAIRLGEMEKGEGVEVGGGVGWKGRGGFFVELKLIQLIFEKKRNVNFS